MTGCLPDHDRCRSGVQTGAAASFSGSGGGAARLTGPRYVLDACQVVDRLSPAKSLKLQRELVFPLNRRSEVRAFPGSPFLKARVGLPPDLGHRGLGVVEVRRVDVAVAGLHQAEDAEGEQAERGERQQQPAVGLLLESLERASEPMRLR